MHTKKLLFYFVVLLTSMLASCSATKYVPKGEYLLNALKISSDCNEIENDDFIPYLRQRPNAKMFESINFNLGLYSLSSPDTTLWINRFLREIGEAPIIYDTAAVSISKIEIKKFLANRGYMNATVDSKTTYKKKKSSIVYSVSCSTPYTINELTYNIEDEDISEAILKDTSNALIKSGDIYNTDQLEEERTRIVKNLRNNGYLNFNKNFIRLEADSTLGKQQVNLELKVDPLKKQSDFNNQIDHQQYKIRNISYYLVDDATDLIEDSIITKLDSINYKGYITHYQDLFIRPATLVSNTFIKPGGYYSQEDIENTYSKLSALNISRYLNIAFKEVTDTTSTYTSTLTDSSNSITIKEIDCRIALSRDKEQSFSFELEGTNNEGDFGIAGKFGFRHNNIFKGGQAFNFQLRGANESIIGERYIWEVSTEMGLEFPVFLIPFLKKSFLKSNQTKSEIYVNYSYQIRDEYSRMIAGTGIRYYWNSPKKVNHTLELIDFNYVFLPYISESFSKTIEESLLKYSYENHLIMRIGYNISYSNKHLRPNRSSFFIRGAIETAGNTLYGICSAVDASQDTTGSYLIGNIPFSQYVKLDGGFTYNERIDDKNSIAYHIAAGAGIPYINSDILPFEKRYYGGGANNVRGWSARDLGPGTYQPGTTIDYMKQSGDISFNMNLEYRTKLVWKMELASFIDAGNIWTLRDEGQEGGVFKWDEFYKQIALSYGLGLRFNFDYFVIRLDWGIKAFDPGQTDGEQWRFTDSWDILKDTALHFAVGYPF